MDLPVLRSAPNRYTRELGAHMEKDIDRIIPVEPGEAQLLIGLLETLFDDWYVARQLRRDRLDALTTLADEKQKARLEPTLPID